VVRADGLLPGARTGYGSRQEVLCEDRLLCLRPVMTRGRRAA
jgi:hypothetical protein